MEPNWLARAKRLQAIAQNGLTFAADPFDRERYREIRLIAAEIIAAGAEIESQQVVEMFAPETGYATPKIDVRGVVFRDDGILLVRERSDQRWTLPGGWGDVGASPRENVEREIFEESGFRARAVKLLAVYDRSRHPHVPASPFGVYKMFFLCEIVDGAPTPGTETDGVKFFRETEIPELSFGRVTPAQIARMFAHRRHPDWPTEFD